MNHKKRRYSRLDHIIERLVVYSSGNFWQKSHHLYSDYPISRWIDKKPTSVEHARAWGRFVFEFNLLHKTS